MVVEEKGFDTLKAENVPEKFTHGKRRNRIRAMLGSNFVALRQSGDELEILTTVPMTQPQRDEIEKVWQRSK